MAVLKTRGNNERAEIEFELAYTSVSDDTAAVRDDAPQEPRDGRFAQTPWTSKDY